MSSVAQPPPRSEVPKDTTPPHIKEMERKRALLAKVKVIREGMLFRSGQVLEGDPNKTYCWVNHRDDRQIFYQALGWTLCKDPRVKTRWVQPDGSHKRADLVLYEIDKDLNEALEAYNSLRGIEAIEGAQDAFIGTLQKDKIPVYKPPV